MSGLALLRDLAEQAATADIDPVQLADRNRNFVLKADRHAVRVLGVEAADALDWEYDEDGPPHTRQASAWLAANLSLRYRHDPDAGRTTLRVIHDCDCCGGTVETPVRELADLAGHLDDDCGRTS